MYEASNTSVWGHDLQDLLNGLKSTINIPKRVFDVCSILNLYYISTQYPDVFTSGHPAQKFSKYQAEEAINFAEEVLNFARKIIK